jgi:hypothetical protein
MPILNSDPLRYVLLYGKTNKQWCDFANAPVGDDDIIYPENSWAVWWEIGFFYAPNTLIFIFNFLIYGRIIMRIRSNAVQLEQRKKIESGNIGREDWAKHGTPPTRKRGNSVISSAKPVKYYSSLKQSESSDSVGLLAEASPSEELPMEPFHFRLSHITIEDIEEYGKFLQSQSRTAAYYVRVISLLTFQIGAFILNWVIWIAARLVWEFAYCSDDPEQSKTHGLFIFILIILQCTGPRLECVLLSIIFGIAENTVSPNTLRDVLSDMTCLRYFKEYCAALEESDLLLYFWFDVMRAKVALKKKIETMKESQSRSLSGETSPQTSTDIEFYGQKIRQYVREISTYYMSETGPLSLNRFQVFSNRERNAIRTFVLQARFRNIDRALEHSDDEDDEEIEEDELEREDSANDSESSETDSLNIDSDTITQSSGSETQYRRLWRSKYKQEARRLEEERKLVRLLGKSQLAAYRKLEQKMAPFKNSNMFQEMCHVLRMKAVSNQRSLYRDLIVRFSSQVKQAIREVVGFLSKPHTMNIASMAGMHGTGTHMIADTEKEKKKKRSHTSLLDEKQSDGASSADQDQSVEAFEGVTADMFVYVKTERDTKRNAKSFMTF